MKILSKLLLFTFAIFFLFIASACTTTPVGDVKPPAAVESPVDVKPIEKPLEVMKAYDVLMVLAETSKTMDSVIQLSLNRESVIKVVNERKTEATFQLPQMDVYEKIPAGETKYITVLPSQNGFYQIQLNSANYGTFQVK